MAGNLHNITFNLPSFFVVKSLAMLLLGNIIFNKNLNTTQLRQRFAIILGVIGIVMVSSQLFLQKHLGEQVNDSRVVNIAGRQRMLSQKLAKQILLISSDNNEKQRKQLSNELKQTLKLWSTSHQGLKNGNLGMGLPGTNSEQIKEMFHKLNPAYQSMVEAGQNIVQLLQEEPLIAYYKLQPDIQIILQNEEVFLIGMNALVFQYDKEAKAKVTHLSQTDKAFLFIILGILLVAAFWLLQMATVQTKKSTALLATME